MPPEHPYDQEQDFNEAEDLRVEALLADMDFSKGEINSILAWLSGDREFYPVSGPTLWEEDQRWATKFGLRTSEQRIERLAQEAKLYLVLFPEP